MNDILQLAAWNLHIARKRMAIILAAYTVQQLALVIYQAALPDMVGQGLAFCFSLAWQPAAFCIGYLAVGFLSCPILGGTDRTHSAYTYQTLPYSPAVKLSAQTLSTAAMLLGFGAWQILLFFAEFLPVTAIQNATAAKNLADLGSLASANLYDQILLCSLIRYMLPTNLLHFFVLLAILFLSALLFCCVWLHRGWRRAVAVVLGCIAAVNAALPLMLVRSLSSLQRAGGITYYLNLQPALICLIIAVFSIWWALRALRRAEFL